MAVPLIGAGSGLPLTLSKLQSVCNRMQVLGSKASEQSSWTRGEGRKLIKNGRFPCTNLRVAIAQFKTVGSPLADTANANTTNAQIVLERRGIPYWFSLSGSNTIAVTPGLSVVISDILPGMSLLANELAYLRYNVTGTSWPEGAVSNGSNPSSFNEYILSNAVTSQVFGVGPLTTPSGGDASSGFSWSPIALLGQFSEATPSVAIIGDSISDYQNDGNGDGFGNICYVSRGLYNVSGATVIPSIKLSHGGDSLSQFNTGGASRVALYQYATHLICQLGTVGLVGYANLAAFQVDILQTWATARAQGLKVYQCLILPRTDAANTSPYDSSYALGGLRDQANTWIKTQVGVTIDGYIDANQYVEDSGNLGFWLSSMTDDGTHMLPAGNLAAAAAVNAVAATFTV